MMKMIEFAEAYKYYLCPIVLRSGDQLAAKSYNLSYSAWSGLFYGWNETPYTSQ
jgi:hypothetical protein